MVANLTFRTADFTRWGGGNGSDLSAVQIDLNFWSLFTAVNALESGAENVGAGIDFINQPLGGNIFFIHLTDHRVLGPFVIPTAQWNPRGPWAPNTPYAAYDVVSNNGAVYLIVIPHTSGSTFSALSTDGFGHLLYNLLLEQADDMLPDGGTPGQRLVKSTSSPFETEWLSDFIRVHTFVEGNPLAGETIIQYTVTDNMTLPLNLIGTAIFQGVQTATTVVWTLFRNGATIGTITFTGPSPESIVVSFTADVHFVPGDIFTLLAPTVPDVAQANISFTFLFTLTL